MRIVQEEKLFSFTERATVSLDAPYLVSGILKTFLQFCLCVCSVFLIYSQWEKIFLFFQCNIFITLPMKFSDSVCSTNATEHISGRLLLKDFLQYGCHFPRCKKQWNLLNYLAGAVHVHLGHLDINVWQKLPWDFHKDQGIIFLFVGYKFVYFVVNQFRNFGHILCVLFSSLYMSCQRFYSFVQLMSGYTSKLIILHLILTFSDGYWFLQLAQPCFRPRPNLPLTYVVYLYC